MQLASQPGCAVPSCTRPGPAVCPVAAWSVSTPATMQFIASQRVCLSLICIVRRRYGADQMKQHCPVQCPGDGSGGGGGGGGGDDDDDGAEDSAPKASGAVSIAPLRAAASMMAAATAAAAAAAAVW